MAGYKDVLKKLVSDALGEDSFEELSRYGKAAVDAGKRATQRVTTAINESDNESIIKARNVVNAVKDAVNDSSSKTYTGTKSVEDDATQVFTSVTCPSCGATLDVDDGIDTFFCKYCGTKVILQNQSKATIKAKETVKKLEHKEVMTDKVMEHLNTRAERKAEEKRRQKDSSDKAMLYLLIFTALFFGLMYFKKSQENRAIKIEDASLQAIVEQIQMDIENDDYDSALIKANGLYFTEDSSENKKKWNNTREALIEHIEELKKSSEAVDVQNINVDTNQSASEIVEQVIIEPKNTAVYHSSGDREIAKEGDTGVYAFKSEGGQYDIYYIVDFDEEYVYRFTDGNGEEYCDRLKIDSGSLASYIVFTYHDGGDTWQNALNFKFSSNPEHVILQDGSGYDTDFYGTDLEAALRLRDSKLVIDY